MASSTAVPVDPVFNDPAPTVIDGVSYTIREIKYRDARRMGLSLVTVLVDAAKGKTPAEVMAGQLDTVEELVKLSAQMEPEALGDLPASHVARLVGRVFERHMDFLQELFNLRRQALGLVPRKNGATPDLAPLNSSSP